MSRAADSSLTVQRLREALSCCLETGALTWLVTNSNSRGAGKLAGYRRPDGYLHISLDGQLYLGHRLVWLYTRGEWPQGEIDHIDGDRTNNRPQNLRDVTMAGNAQNRSRAQGKNPYLGVSWDGGARKWKASIRVDGRQRNLGRFLDPLEAHRCYLRAKATMHIPTMVAGSAVL